MSFDHNPFCRIEILYRGELDVPKDSSKVYLYCHGCGAELGPHPMGVGLFPLFQQMEAHIRQSHRRTPEEMRSWSR